MPIHNWDRVDAGIFHHFHVAWITTICNALNENLLPRAYYALAERVTGPYGPDVLALQTNDSELEPITGEPPGAIAVATAAPKVHFVARTDMDRYATRQRSVVIRHRSGDRIVALIEILSPGNKASQVAMQAFVQKAVDALQQGYHLLLIDLHPPTRRDPQGIHGVLWSEFEENDYLAPPDKPLTLAAYSSSYQFTAYVEPVRPGDALPDMPLFLTAEYYIPVPLEATYQTAWRGMPRRWREVLDPGEPT